MTSFLKMIFLGMSLLLMVGCAQKNAMNCPIPKGGYPCWPTSDILQDIKRQTVEEKEFSASQLNFCPSKGGHCHGL